MTGFATELGEYKQWDIKDVRCEHNLPKLPELQGDLIQTNYKLVFRPSENQPKKTLKLA